MEFYILLVAIGLAGQTVWANSTSVAPEIHVTETSKLEPKIVTNEVQVKNPPKQEEKAIVPAGSVVSILNAILGVIGGNVKVALHGDLSNAASANVESRGSVGVSINGQDISVGAKFGIGGNLGQGLSNTGSIGAGGRFNLKPNITLNKPKNSVNGAPPPPVKPMDMVGNKGTWQNVKEYFNFFVEHGKRK